MGDENTVSGESERPEEPNGSGSSRADSQGEQSTEKADSSSIQPESQSTKAEDNVNEQHQQQSEGNTTTPSGNERTENRNAEQPRRSTHPTTVTPNPGAGPAGAPEERRDNSEDTVEVPTFKPRGPGFQHSAQRKRFDREQAQRQGR